MKFQLAQRTQVMNPSVIRELLKLSERPDIISLAGGLPSPRTFPIEALREAADRVLHNEGAAALQYAASEGHLPLREWVAGDLHRQGMSVSADQVLITTGSQQGLDLVAKVLIDAGSPVLVEAPTYLGALQAFAPMQPRFVAVQRDAQGLLPTDLRAKAAGARLLYVLPNFQNPSGHTLCTQRRSEIAEVALDCGIPIVEDNPYGDLWFDQPPPAAISAQLPEQAIYLGSFSKTLAPGLRLGYAVAPQALYPKLLQAKQAADLHTPSFNQRLVAQVLRSGFIDTHLVHTRALYKSQCQAMLSAVERHLAPLGVRCQRPLGGMFVWTQLPSGLSADALLPMALERGVAFVPGSAFFVDHADPSSLRLSFVTANASEIERGIQVLAQAIEHALTQAA